MADDLTPRQREILDFIRNSLEVLGAPPTRAEIAGTFGFASANAAEDHLKALARKGTVVLDPGSARGNSMTGAGILDGDLLAVHRTAEARSGQIVVAHIEDEVTVKRLRKKGARIELVAENPDYAPIVVNGPLAIEGLAVGLNRKGSAL